MELTATRTTGAQGFFTDTGIEVPAVTTAEMREVDRIAIEETGPNLFQMMENAGRNLAELAMEVLGTGWREADIVVLAGTGGNGGGGICGARHLANRGMRVALCLTNPKRLGRVTAWQRQVFRSTSGIEIEIADLPARQPDLILDAIVGYSLKGSPHGAAAEVIRWANKAQAPILALDVPSGVDSTSGEAAGDFIRTSWTMTLALPKLGLRPSKTGHLVLADIGIPNETFKRLGLKYVTPFDHRYRVPLTPGA